MTNHYKYFSHKECEFFPCHKESDGKDFDVYPKNWTHIN